MDKSFANAIKGIPQPIPDAEELFHFQPVNETPTTDENGKLQAPDDFQPRANIKRLVSEGTLSCKEVELAVLKEICCGARLGTSLHCTFAGFENSEQYQSKAPH